MQRWKMIIDEGQLLDQPVERYDDYIPDLGFTSDAHPKLKFNFIVDLTFRKPFAAEDSKEGGMYMGHDVFEEFALPVKTVSRPNVTITYTDINYYNYRTKVATKTEPGTGTIIFYDDADNKVHTLYKAYMNLMSPISNERRSAALLDSPDEIPFGQMSSLGVMEDAAGIIRTLRVFHYYIVRGNVRRNIYTYINPKIQTFELDDLSMLESDTSTISMTFGYDAVTTVQDDDPLLSL